jgi:ABC-type sulfate/molybdate transport systems ATPase subunit
LRARTSISTVVVTHDLEQARRLADYVVRIEGGRVTAQGGTAEVLDQEIEPAIAAAEDAT